MIMGREVDRRLERERERVREMPAYYRQRHLGWLGFNSEDDYIEWRLRHGFQTKIPPTVRDLKAELRQRWDEVATEDLRNARRKSQSFQGRLESVLEGNADLSELPAGSLFQIGRFLARGPDRRLRSAFCRLIRHVGKAGKFLEDECVIPEFGQQEFNTCVHALAAMAEHYTDWLRAPEDWRPATHNRWRQFRSLARHLFAVYPVPEFLDCVWFLGTGREGWIRQKWYIHLGCGRSIRKERGLPIPLTQRMAHWFLQTPPRYTVDQALRRAQLIAFGGTPRLADAVLGTRIGTDFSREEFWSPVIRFFVTNPMLDPAQVGPIVDYIHNQRFEWRDVIVERGRYERHPPPQPNFTMRGRSVESLLRQAHRWHRTLAVETKSGHSQWAWSGIPDFRLEEGGENTDGHCVWTIHELLSSGELIEEGRRMQHCVASYAASCQSGRTTIWSLRLRKAGAEKRVLTVEVLPRDRVIVEARGRLNARPKPVARRILERWAQTAGLSIAGHVW